MGGSLQNDEGSIPELIGATLSYIRAVCYRATKNVLLVWIHNEASNLWYRIYMDACLCFADHIAKNGFVDDYNEDHDQDLFYEDYASWFSSKIV